MNSQKVLYNKVGNDESYTPDYGVKPIVKYVKKRAKDILRKRQYQEVTIWCPFDKENNIRRIR